MSIFKCKMCGGTIEFEQGSTVGVCDSCGSRQTLPRLDDDKKANLYNRANHFRRSNDFDKAMSIYEQILNEDSTDAESYWSLVLCRYGIEYVEDPISHKRIPTVNRAQLTSVFADEDYKSAIRYADRDQKSIYEEEARAIDEIQKGILEISQKEEPFDVFISFKETDANGRRTPDAVLANDLYHQLTQEGFKVFFSPITLEDKLGSEYEPYIFAALNSAKVMVVLGTNPEHFNAVWVKNEWSRYLALIKDGAEKVLIPAYRDMDPYDLPEEFSNLMAQDMSKLGFMQDIIRGIKKIVGTDTVNHPAAETVVINSNVNIEPLLKRAFMFLEDGEWHEADRYCERVLDQEPERAQAYLCKLMAELHVHTQDDLKNCLRPFDDSSNYRKVLRFADPALAQAMEDCIAYINLRNKYSSAGAMMNAANTEETYKLAAAAFKSLSGFKDADAYEKQCLKKAEACRRDAIYSAAMSKKLCGTIPEYEDAIALFCTIPGWKDADKLVKQCQKAINNIKTKEKNERRMIIFFLSVVILGIIILILVCKANHENDQTMGNNNTTIADVSVDSDKSTEIGELAEINSAESFETAEIGDAVLFGSYAQGNDDPDNKESVEWLVLDKQDGKALVISRYALDCRPYNDTEIDRTWRRCDLNTWLNETFIKNVFTWEERKKIVQTEVSADKNPKFDTDPGIVTEDKIFLLSVDEVQKYFSPNSEKVCHATAYAKAQGASAAKSGSCAWWLRTPGDHQSFASYVDSDGAVRYNGAKVSSIYIAVRPAMWVGLDS